jgi:Bacterial Ig-like domain
MKNQIKLIGAIAAVALIAMATAWAQSTKAISVRALPPAVVKTVPAAGATEVDPDLKEITATFSKDMIEGSFSACNINEESFPKLDGKLHFEADKRTCVLPVKLEPGKAYAVWFNYGAKYYYFRDTSRKSAVPYLLVFETRSAH